MAEVYKRDAQAVVIDKLVRRINRLADQPSLADVTIYNRELDATWARYQKLHEMVMDRAGSAEVDEQTNIFNNVYDVYMAASATLCAHLLTFKEAAHPPGKGHASQQQPHHALGRIVVNIEHRAAERLAELSVAVAAPQLRTLEDLYSKYQTALVDAMTSAADSDAAAILEEQDEVSTSYLRTAALLKGVIAPDDPPLAQPQQQQVAALKIPAIQIGTFDGTMSKWESFRESFEHVYHVRESMPDVQKLQHLKSCLRGEAEELISNFSLTNDNYDVAWALLNQRYNNVYEIARAHMRTLTSLPLCKESSSDLRRLLNKTSATLLALRNLKRPVDYWSDWIVHHVTEKLDNETRKLWEQRQVAHDVFPDWPELELFLENRLRSLTAVATIRASPQTSSSLQSKKIHSHVVSSQPSQQKRRCPCCNHEHAIYMCHPFRQLSYPERRALVTEKKLCFNCLDSRHMVNECRNEKGCRFCGQLHNSLLHNDSSAITGDQAVAVHHSTLDSQFSSPVLLATAIIRIRATDDSIYTFRALLDQGSQASLITERAAQLLQIQKRRAVDCELVGVGATPAGQITHAVTIHIMSRFNDSTVAVDVGILHRVSHSVALPAGTDKQWSHLNGLELADPHFMQHQKIDILIGADIYGSLLRSGIRKGPAGAPVAQNTSLGWIVSGPVSASSPPRSVVSFNLSTVDSKIDECLERFWAVENIEPSRCTTIDEEVCETHFQSTSSRDSTGRFHVRIPFRNQQPTLGESLQMAIRRQLQMERKFESSESFATEYRKFMAQYHDLGHMKLLGSIDATITRQHPHYYIPHHAVLKESSSTTKLRVVFDASRQTTNGLSLNEQMLPGTRLQDDLSTIVLRWRKHRIVFTADVERMYRQIIIDEPDADYQRIVWRNSPDRPMQIYQLSTVTYGTTSAPYLAVKSLQRLADLEKNRFPIGCAIAAHDFYVDDVLTGFDDIDSAMHGQHQLRELMTSGGFELKKWTSNNSTLLNHFPAGYCECQTPLELNLDQHVKTLGIQWNPVSDQFTFKINFSFNAPTTTKRQFLSDSARLYDPLGWLAPSVILVKMMFQRLWQLNLSWDDQLPDIINNQWSELRDAFSRFQELRIDRWIGTTTTSTIELHGFCDASIHAYAAAIYVRTISGDGSIVARLLCAKTKVAPVKTISLPRLELCGAVLLGKLMQQVISSMKFERSSIHCWTDSTIVLAWIKGCPTRWSVFVANRVAEIQRTIPFEHWHHVVSEENPADCASRGVQPHLLKQHELWWSGPKWLGSTQQLPPNTVYIADTDLEMRAKCVVNAAVVEPSSFDMKLRFSSLTRLERVTAYCLRFINNTRNPPNCRINGPLTTDELHAAHFIWIKDAQRDHFSDEFKRLRASQPISRTSTLRSLNPILHDDGILRVGGRLANSTALPIEMTAPIIIPKRSKFADLLITHSHLHTLHGGPSLMLAYIRQRFWVIDGPNHARHFVKKCNKCFRFSSTLGQQMMAALPSARVTPSRPFSHTAMDYSGAVMIRSARGRGQHATKGYIAVFVCLVTKAIHIEVVSDLTSVAFIAAYKRFTGRRGICTDIYSDNATNYVGAAAIFSKTEREKGFNNDVISTLATMGTKWHFSPPLSPHFNGLAESAIRSVKHHVRRIINDATLTYEELSTFLTQVECCLNSRPLYALSSDPTAMAVLTPAHFLVGGPLNAVPERNILSAKPNALTRWQLTTQMFQRFWVQWANEYLHTLQQRKKWQQRNDNFAVGDLVLMKDDNRPPLSWPLARVTEVHPGADGNVRVVTLRTATQTMKLSIVKLAKLPSQHEPSEEGTF